MRRGSEVRKKVTAALVLAGLGAGLIVLGRRSTTGRIHDRRSRARLRDKAQRQTRTRSADDVYAVVLHQMGFSRGSNVDRYDRVTAHYAILPDGTILHLHDHEKRLPASSGLNHGSIAIEFAGNFPSRSRSNEDRHFWQPDVFGKDQLTPAQVESARWLLSRFKDEGWLTHVLAHRQSGPQRQNDPGPDVWREVGAWAVQQLGLDWGGDAFSVTGGRPIPASWWGVAA